MNKNLRYTYPVLLLLCFVYMISCKKNNVVIDRPITQPPAFAKFSTIAPGDSAATYYIKSTNDVYKLPIGITNVTNTDRTINFTYTSTAVQGQQFNAPTSLVIKAGQSLDTLVISGLFAGYPSSSRVDILKISISGGDVPASSYKGNYFLTLRKYCDVILPNFYGVYNNSIDNGNYGPYRTTVVANSGVATSATTGTIKFTNVWDFGVPSITTTVNLDWADPKNFKLTIPDQVYYGPAGIWIKNSATTGTFSSCDQKFVLNYTLYFKATGAAYYANQQTVISR